MKKSDRVVIEFSFMEHPDWSKISEFLQKNNWKSLQELINSIIFAEEKKKGFLRSREYFQWVICKEIIDDYVKKIYNEDIKEQVQQ